MNLLIENTPELFEGISDEDLLNRAISSPRLFSILVDRYQAPFLRKARSIIRDEEVAHDIVQDTFVKIYRYAYKFEKREGASFSSWGYKILMNVSFSHYQKRKKIGLATTALSDELMAVLGDKGSKADTQNKETRDYVDSVFSLLPRHFSTVLRRYFLDGRNQLEIAEEEGLSVGAIKTRMHRAKKAFRIAMATREY
jgi:RNA polymerase sigma factor (sigma-70 family)